MVSVVWPSQNAESLRLRVETLLNTDSHLHERFTFRASPQAVDGESVIAVLPIYTAEAPKQLDETGRACRKTQARLHILALCSSTAQLLFGDSVPNADENEQKSIDVLLQLSLGDVPASHSLVNIPDVSFNILAEYLAMVIGAMIFDYSRFPSLSLTRHYPGQNLAIGVSALRYDIERSEKLCYHRVFLDALNGVNIAQDDVDTQKVAELAENISSIITDTYTKIYHTDILHPFRKEKITVEEFMVRAAITVEKKFENLNEHINALLADKSLSMPEKEAVLAETTIDTADAEAAAIIKSSDLESMKHNVEQARRKQEQTIAVQRENLKHFKESNRSLRRLCPPLYLRRLYRKHCKAESAIETARAEFMLINNDFNETSLAVEVAKMWVSHVGKLKKKLTDLHTRLSAYNKTLLAWRNEAIAALVATSKHNTSLINTLEDDESLTLFYERHCKPLADNINIWETFLNIAFDRESVDSARERLESITRRAIAALFDSFSLTEYLMGQEYPYLHPTSLTEQLHGMDVEAIPPGTSADSAERDTLISYMYAGMEPQRVRTWSEAVGQTLDYRPEILTITDCSRIMLLKIRPQAYEYYD